MRLSVLRCLHWIPGVICSLYKCAVVDCVAQHFLCTLPNRLLMLLSTLHRLGHVILGEPLLLWRQTTHKLAMLAPTFLRTSQYGSHSRYQGQIRMVRSSLVQQTSYDLNHAIVSGRHEYSILAAAMISCLHGLRLLSSIPAHSYPLRQTDGTTSLLGSIHLHLSSFLGIYEASVEHLAASSCFLCPSWMQLIIFKYYWSKSHHARCYSSQWSLYWTVLFIVVATRHNTTHDLVLVRWKY